MTQEGGVWDGMSWRRQRGGGGLGGAGVGRCVLMWESISI